MLRQLSLCTILVVAATGCGERASRADAAPVSTPLAELDASSWALQQFAGHDLALPEDRQVTLKIEGTRLGGRAPCNSYGADLTEREGRVTIGPILSSKMACDRLDLEQAYFAALTQVTSVRRDGANLTLAGADATLVFGAAARD